MSRGRSASGHRREPLPEGEAGDAILRDALMAQLRRCQDLDRVPDALRAEREAILVMAEALNNWNDPEVLKHYVLIERRAMLSHQNVFYDQGTDQVKGKGKQAGRWQPPEKRPLHRGPGRGADT